MSALWLLIDVLIVCGVALLALPLGVLAEARDARRERELAQALEARADGEEPSPSYRDAALRGVPQPEASVAHRERGPRPTFAVMVGYMLALAATGGLLLSMCSHVRGLRGDFISTGASTSVRHTTSRFWQVATDEGVESIPIPWGGDACAPGERVHLWPLVPVVTCGGRFHVSALCGLTLGYLMLGTAMRVLFLVGRDLGAWWLQRPYRSW